MTEPMNTSILPLTETGGARIGWNFWLACNWSYPLATLTVSEKGVDISTRWVVRNYHLEIADIQSVSRGHGLTSNAIRFFSTAPGCPAVLVFGTVSAARFNRIKLALAEVGIDVTALS